MVTVRCITYNHEKFIKDALEGFISQQTDFRFEVIVHDDCSTDRTAEIVKEYARKYPSIIKPIFEEKNIYRDPGKPVLKILDTHMRGKYVAMCEGDDYWTDQHKLQKQVDFLESHPDFQMCFHGSLVHYEYGNKEDHPWTIVEDREYTPIELTFNYLSQTASLVFRRTFYDSELYKRFPPELMFDVPMIAINAQLGRVWGFPELMNVYRRHPGGVSLCRHEPGFALKRMEKIANIIGGDLLAHIQKTPRKRLWANCYQTEFKDYIENKDYSTAFKAMRKSLGVSVYHTIRAFVSMRWNIKGMLIGKKV